MRGYVRNKYRRDLEGLAALHWPTLARLLRGELLPERPYRAVQWVLRLKPFRPLELYWLYENDEEFGCDLRILYARKSLTVPTEDAYVFAWDYLALLARYGRGALPLTEAAPGPEWLQLVDIAPESAAPLENVSLGPREEFLRGLPADLVKVAWRRMDCGSFSDLSGGWQIIWPLLADLALRLKGMPDGIQVAFDNHGGKKYGPEFLMSFAWLYLNALIRECRQVDPSLPRLSRYF